MRYVAITLTLILAVLLFAVTGEVSRAEDQDVFWYRIDVDGTSYYGSSKYSEEELADILSRNAYILVENLVYLDYRRQRVKNWDEVFPQYEPKIYINSARVTSFQPFKGDARNYYVTSEENK